MKLNCSTCQMHRCYIRRWTSAISGQDTPAPRRVHPRWLLTDKLDNKAHVSKRSEIAFMPVSQIPVSRHQASLPFFRCSCEFPVLRLQFSQLTVTWRKHACLTYKANAGDCSSYHRYHMLIPIDSSQAHDAHDELRRYILS